MGLTDNSTRAAIFWFWSFSIFFDIQETVLEKASSERSLLWWTKSKLTNPLVLKPSKITKKEKLNRYMFLPPYDCYGGYISLPPKFVCLNEILKVPICHTIQSNIIIPQKLI